MGYRCRYRCIVNSTNKSLHFLSVINYLKTVFVDTLSNNVRNRCNNNGDIVIPMQQSSLHSALPNKMNLSVTNEPTCIGLTQTVHCWHYTRISYMYEGYANVCRFMCCSRVVYLFGRGNHNISSLPAVSKSRFYSDLIQGQR
jgi:hypothetical protein